MGKPPNTRTRSPSGLHTHTLSLVPFPPKTSKQVRQEEIKMMVSDLDAGVDLQDDDGWTCVHWAAQHGCADSLRAVLEGIKERSSGPEAAAEVTEHLVWVRDKDGKTAAEIAQSAGHEEALLKKFMDVLEGREEVRGDMAELD